MYKCVFVSLVVQINIPFVVRHHRFLLPRLHSYKVIHLAEYRCDCQKFPPCLHPNVLLRIIQHMLKCQMYHLFYRGADRLEKDG